MRINRLFVGVFAPALLIVLAIMASGCKDKAAENYGDLPENVGYLHSGTPQLGQLTIFDADTFEVYRSVETPISWVARSHRLELDPMGRIWIGYAQDGMSRRGRHSGVQVLSPRGELEHDLDLGCAPPDGGIAFANGFAFVGCAASGFTGRVYVVDLESMDVVHMFDDVIPPGENAAESNFYITTIVEVGGAIVVVAMGSPPRDYPSLTPHSATYTRALVIDAESLEIRGWLVGLEPGLEVYDVLDVGGRAWLFNALSHLEEHAPRVDVYVFDPVTVEVVDRFNLEHPFPKWSVQDDEGTVYISHRVAPVRLRDTGLRSGVTKIDVKTGEESFLDVPHRFGFKDLDVYRGTVCMPNRHNTLNGSEDVGLWCLDDQGNLELRIKQDQATGIKFVPSSTE
jgi:hypothetical protein